MTYNEFCTLIMNKIIFYKPNNLFEKMYLIIWVQCVERGEKLKILNKQSNVPKTAWHVHS